MPIPVLDIWKSGGWVLPDGKTSIRVPNEEQALREGALHFVLGKDGVMDIYMWNTESNDMVTKFLERFAPPEDQYLRFHSAEPHGELMKRMFGRSKFLNKKADPEVKQYGQPT